jgi:Leucine rich repeat
MLTNFKYILCCLITAVTLVSCSGPVAGGGSDTEVSSRKVAGVVLDSAGAPVADAVVKIRPSKYIADSLYSGAYTSSHYVRDRKTGADGSFCFDSILADDYCLDISKEDSIGAVNQFSISDSIRELRLSSINLEPFAVIDGNIRVFGVDSLDCFLQVVGTDYSRKADTNGYFTMRIPRGWHTVHFGAYEPSDTLKTKSIDHIDFSFDINENYKYMGDFWLKPTPPEPCTDFSCDSIIMRKALDDMHLYSVDVNAVTIVENNRIVGLNLRRIPIFYLSKYVESLTELRTLDLGFTGIFEVLPTIGMLQKLESLKLDSNGLKYLPFGLIYLRSLKSLDINSNFISGMPHGFQNLKLQNLDLSKNTFCSPDSVFVNWADIYDPDWRSGQFCPSKYP